MRGIGTDINKKMAFELCQKAENIGSAFGMNNLGVCYTDGIGTNVNKQMAFKIFQKVENLGYAFGMTNLGVCY